MTCAATTYPVLGRTATLRVPDGTELPDTTVGRIRARWGALERLFDPSRPDSELSLIFAGRGSVQNASPAFRAAHADAVRWRNDTGGHFRPFRPGGVMDLDGLSKAYALREAAVELAGSGVESWLVELDGDVISDALGAEGWTTGIPDPSDENRLLAVLPLGGSWTALATAGAGRAEENGGFVQATVLCRDIVAAHALATAVVSGGRQTFQLAVARWPVDMVTVDGSGGFEATPRLQRHLRRSTEGSISARGSG